MGIKMNYNELIEIMNEQGKYELHDIASFERKENDLHVKFLGGTWA